MTYLELLPAVDVKDGRAVRLVQGELSAETAYGNPLEQLLADCHTRFQQRVHLAQDVQRDLLSHRLQEVVRDKS